MDCSYQPCFWTPNLDIHVFFYNTFFKFDFLFIISHVYVLCESVHTNVPQHSWEAKGQLSGIGSLMGSRDQT